AKSITLRHVFLMRKRLHRKRLVLPVTMIRWQIRHTNTCLNRLNKRMGGSSKLIRNIKFNMMKKEGKSIENRPETLTICGISNKDRKKLLEIQAAFFDPSIHIKTFCHGR